MLLLLCYIFIVTITNSVCTPISVLNSDKSSANSISGATSDTVLVTCDSGYTVSPVNGITTCQNTGIFTAIVCNADACSTSNVANSDYASSNIVGNTSDTVTVTCDAGYTASPSNGIATCQSSGTFTTVTCVADACTPSEVPNSDKSGAGSVTGNTGDVVTIVCSGGRNASPNANMTCQSDNTWTSVVCLATDECDAHVAPTNGGVGDCYVVVASGNCQPTCNTGFSVTGTSTCAASGGTLTSANCHADNCFPTEIAYSNKSIIGSLIGIPGDIVTIECSAGYSGSGNTVCQNDGTFSPTKTCTPNTCTPISSVANSDYSATSITGTTGIIVIVTCDIGYDDDGHSTGMAICRPDGTFTSVTCSPSECQPTSVANSDKSGVNSVTGFTTDVVAIVCDATFTAAPSANSTCQTNGYFSTVVCLAANECDATAPPSNGTVGNCSKLIADGTCQPECNIGYTVSGTSICASSGGTLTAATCIANPCAATLVSNSDKSTPGSLVGITGDVIAVVCDTGYTGDGNATCQTDGTFSIVFCGTCAATEVSNSNKSVTGSIYGDFGTVVSVICDAGYTGSANTTCQANGTFSAVSCSVNETCNNHITVSGNICPLNYSTKTNSLTSLCSTTNCDLTTVTDRDICCSKVVMKVKHQYSHSSCKYTDDYGFTDITTIWVDNGCDALFEFIVDNSSYLVHCKSIGFSYTSCTVPLCNVHMLKQKSGSPCKYGQSYGCVDASGIWVNYGCAATFNLNGSPLNCSSSGFGYTTC